jgi:hypothetical protein
MNERIKELMNQTGIPTTIPFDQWCEKFAQLIINKCLDVCYNTGMNSESYDGQLNVAELIKQQFGVEE